MVRADLEYFIFKFSYFLEGTFEQVGLLLISAHWTFSWRFLLLNFYKNCENHLIFSPQWSKYNTRHFSSLSKPLNIDFLLLILGIVQALFTPLR